MTTFPWQRYWYPEGTEIALQDRDFLPDPSQEWARFYNVSVETLHDIGAPCAILLGEPGAGKSKAVEQYVGAANLSAPDSVLLLDLKGHSSDHAVDLAVFQHPRVTALTSDPDAGLVLSLDSLDELLLNEPGAGSFIARKLTQLPPERLKLRLVCRRAEWMPSLENILGALYGRDGVRAYRLAPLTAADVVTAAVASGLPGEDFLQQVVERNLQPFARKPFTLVKFLIAVFLQEQGFPASETHENGRWASHCIQRPPRRRTMVRKPCPDRPSSGNNAGARVLWQIPPRWPTSRYLLQATFKGRCSWLENPFMCKCELQRLRTPAGSEWLSRVRRRACPLLVAYEKYDSARTILHCPLQMCCDYLVVDS